MYQVEDRPSVFPSHPTQALHYLYKYYNKNIIINVYIIYPNSIQIKIFITNSSSGQFILPLPRHQNQKTMSMPPQPHHTWPDPGTVLFVLFLFK